MPGGPKECRRNALRCAELAHSARTPGLKQTLISLSNNWLKLAIELERADVPPDMETVASKPGGKT